MKSRLARAAVAGVMVLILIVTPLSTVLSGGQLETWLPGYGSDMGSNPSVHVVLQDETGFVRAIVPALSTAMDGVENPNGNRMMLVATWLGGCGDRVAHLQFARAGDRFLLTQRTDEFGCPFLIGYSRSVAIALWSPIDAALVDFKPQITPAE